MAVPVAGEAVSGQRKIAYPNPGGVEQSSAAKEAEEGGQDAVASIDIGNVDLPKLIEVLRDDAADIRDSCYDRVVATWLGKIPSDSAPQHRAQLEAAAQCVAAAERDMRAARNAALADRFVYGVQPNAALAPGPQLTHVGSLKGRNIVVNYALPLAQAQDLKERLGQWGRAQKTFTELLGHK
jgi:hypothetical protein